MNIINPQSIPTQFIDAVDEKSSMEKPIFSESIGDVSQDINLKDAKGKTKLHLAAESGDFEEFTRLIQLGANAKARDNEGNNVLMAAVSYDEDAFGYFKALFGRKDKAKVCKESNEFKEFERKSISKAKIVKILVEGNYVDIGSRNKKGKTAYEIAFAQGMGKSDDNKNDWLGDTRIIPILLQNGANPVVKERHSRVLGSYTRILMFFAAVEVVIYSIGRFINRYTPSFVGDAFAGIASLFNYLNVFNAAKKVGEDNFEKESAEGLDLNEVSLIGSYHINNYGKVVYGDGLQKYLSRRDGYVNHEKAFYDFNKLEKDRSSQLFYRISNGRVEIDQARAAKIDNQILANYIEVRNKLDKGWLPLQTKWGLENLLEDLQKAHSRLNNANSKSLAELYEARKANHKEHKKDVVKSSIDPELELPSVNVTGRDHSTALQVYRGVESKAAGWLKINPKIIRGYFSAATTTCGAYAGRNPATTAAVALVGGVGVVSTLMNVGINAVGTLMNGGAAMYYGPCAYGSDSDLMLARTSLHSESTSNFGISKELLIIGALIIMSITAFLGVKSYCSRVKGVIKDKVREEVKH